MWTRNAAEDKTLRSQQRLLTSEETLKAVEVSQQEKQAYYQALLLGQQKCLEMKKREQGQRGGLVMLRRSLCLVLKHDTGIRLDIWRTRCQSSKFAGLQDNLVHHTSLAAKLKAQTWSGGVGLMRRIMHEKMNGEVHMRIVIWRTTQQCQTNKMNNFHDSLAAKMRLQGYAVALTSLRQIMYRIVMGEIGMRIYIWRIACDKISNSRCSLVDQCKLQCQNSGFLILYYWFDRMMKPELPSRIQIWKTASVFRAQLAVQRAGMRMLCQILCRVFMSEVSIRVEIWRMALRNRKVLNVMAIQGTLRRTGKSQGHSGAAKILRQILHRMWRHKLLQALFTWNETMTSSHNVCGLKLAGMKMLKFSFSRINCGCIRQIILRWKEHLVAAAQESQLRELSIERFMAVDGLVEKCMKLGVRLGTRLLYQAALYRIHPLLERWKLKYDSAKGRKMSIQWLKDFRGKRERCDIQERIQKWSKLAYHHQMMEGPIRKAAGHRNALEAQIESLQIEVAELCSMNVKQHIVIKTGVGRLMFTFLNASIVADVADAVSTWRDRCLASQLKLVQFISAIGHSIWASSQEKKVIRGLLHTSMLSAAQASNAKAPREKDFFPTKWALNHSTSLHLSNSSRSMLFLQMQMKEMQETRSHALVVLARWTIRCYKHKVAQDKDIVRAYPLKKGGKAMLMARERQNEKQRHLVRGH